VVDTALERFYRGEGLEAEAAELAGRLDREAGVVAFSGGPDSTALLLAVARRRAGEGPPVAAVHVDHGMDPGSRQRARRAARLARQIGVPFVEHRLAAAAGGESAEAAARRGRYRFLARVAAGLGAGWIATGHHRDDQAETVLLRLAFGSGLRGLAAIRPAALLPASLLPASLLPAPRRPAPGSTPAAASPAGSHARVAEPVRRTRPALLRPLLSLPRQPLAEAVRAAGLDAVADPTNLDPAIPRNRVRHHLLPLFAERNETAGEPPLAVRLAELAGRVRRAAAALDLRLRDHLAPRSGGTAIAVPRSALAALPEPLLPHALALLHRRAGAPYPAGREARRELERQLAAGGAVGCDCGGGWRWESREGEVVLRRGAGPARRRPGEGFSYILVAPGEVEIPELGLLLRLRPAAPAPWMYRGAPDRAALALELAPGDAVTVRNRRPGDRLQPLGAAGSRRLKQVLIDRRVPRRHRDRLPLLVVGGEIAWVPGVTVAERFRLPPAPAAGATVWVAELVEP
jgi:tRNA(Ile)-lysidine synthase